MRKNYCVGYL